MSEELASPIDSSEQRPSTSARREQYQAAVTEQKKGYQQLHQMQESSGIFTSDPTKLRIDEARKDLESTSLGTTEKRVVTDALNELEKRQNRANYFTSRVASYVDNYTQGQAERGIQINNEAKKNMEGSIAYWYLFAQRPQQEVQIELGVGAVRIYVEDRDDFKKLHTHLGGIRSSNQLPEGFFRDDARVYSINAPGESNQELRIPVCVVLGLKGNRDADITMIHEQGHAINSVITSALNKNKVDDDRTIADAEKINKDIEQVLKWQQRSQQNIPLITPIMERVLQQKQQRLQKDIIAYARGKAHDELIATLVGGDTPVARMFVENKNYDYINKLKLSDTYKDNPQILAIVDQARESFIKQTEIQVEAISKARAYLGDKRKDEFLTMLRSTPFHKWNRAIRRHYGEEISLYEQNEPIPAGSIGFQHFIEDYTRVGLGDEAQAIEQRREQLAREARELNDIDARGLSKEQLKELLQRKAHNQEARIKASEDISNRHRELAAQYEDKLKKEYPQIAHISTIAGNGAQEVWKVASQIRSTMGGRIEKGDISIEGRLFNEVYPLVGAIDFDVMQAADALKADNTTEVPSQIAPAVNLYQEMDRLYQQKSQLEIEATELSKEFRDRYQDIFDVRRSPFERYDLTGKLDKKQLAADDERAQIFRTRLDQIKAQQEELKAKIDKFIEDKKLKTA